MNREKINSVIGIVAIVVLFVLSSAITRRYFDEFNLSVLSGFFGMFIYLILVIISIVVAPVSAMPLLPLASGLWGWQFAAVLSIVGWTIGAWIAFWLARKYGVPLISKLINLKRIQKFEKLIPEENLFLAVVFFRMVIPVDGLSYFLGLFSKMKTSHYLIATVIGITPFAFIFAYAGTLSIYYQLAAFTAALVVFAIGLYIAYLRKKRKGVKNRK